MAGATIFRYSRCTSSSKSSSIGDATRRVLDALIAATERHRAAPTV